MYGSKQMLTSNAVGFPRKMDQFELFESMVFPASFAVLLECSREKRLERLLKRGEWARRQDDTHEIIQKRFHTYEHVAWQVIDVLERECKLIKIDADQPVERVFEDVYLALESRLNLEVKVDRKQDIPVEQNA